MSCAKSTPLSPLRAGGSRSSKGAPLVRRAADAAGFSIIELMAVLAVMSLLAVAAAPSFTAIMRDRRTNQAALRVVDVYRSARATAIGRGLPVLVDWNQAGTLAGNGQPGGTGSLTVYEPYVRTFAPSLPCGRTAWDNVNAVPTDGAVQQTNLFDIKNGRYEFTALTATYGGGAQGRMQICFAPSGLTFVRFTTTGGFVQMTNVPVFTVNNQSTGANRTVFVPPNGVARIQL